jgi:hypothetical protein
MPFYAMLTQFVTMPIFAYKIKLSAAACLFNEQLNVH